MKWSRISLPILNTLRKIHSHLHEYRKPHQLSILFPWFPQCFFPHLFISQGAQLGLNTSPRLAGGRSPCPAGSIPQQKCRVFQMVFAGFHGIKTMCISWGYNGDDIRFTSCKWKIAMENHHHRYIIYKLLK